MRTPEGFAQAMTQRKAGRKALTRCLADLATRLPFAACLALSLVGRASAEEVSVGAERITIPAPVGFIALADQAPRFRAMVQRNYSPNTTLIEYFLTEGDFKDVAAGHSSSRKRSLVVSVPTSLLGVEMSEVDFNKLASYFRKVDAGANESGRLAQNKKIAADHVTQHGAVVEIVKSTPLGIFVDKKDIIGKASEEDVQAGEELQRRAVATVAIRVRGVVVNISCSSLITSNSDAAWVRSTCSNWADEILGSN